MENYSLLWKRLADLSEQRKVLVRYGYDVSEIDLQIEGLKENYKIFREETDKGIRKNMTSVRFFLRCPRCGIVCTSKMQLKQHRYESHSY